MKPIDSDRHFLRLAAAAAFSLSATVALAVDRDDRPRDTTDPQIPSAEAKAFGGAQAPNARLARLFDAGGAPVRTKGVQSIQRIDTGVYCIRPARTANINVNRAIVIATVDYFYSQLDEVEVQWASTQSGCGAGRLGIYTLADTNRDGLYSFSNAVGFSIIVP